MMHIPTWRTALLLLALAPLAYYFVAIFAAVRFLRRERARSLPDFHPPVSILKPVRGVDFATYENFSSFCRQSYPDYEILFCVNDLSDPAVAVIHKVMAEFPQNRIRILTDAAKLGTNQKVNNLVLLAQAAEHEILIQSDGDVRVGPNYLREMASPFADEQLGVLSCFYRSTAQANLGAELEAIGAASDFFAGALVADWKEGVTFALGASLATTKTWLSKIGGYESLVDLLADDYEIGNRVHKAGGKVRLSREIVWTMYPAQTLRGFWDHQVRWARTVRVVRPFSYLGLLVTQGLPWAIVAALVTPTATVGAAYLLSYLILRLTVAWVVGAWGIGDEVVGRKLWLVPFRDAVHFLVWLAGFTSNHVNWGGVEYDIRGGKMTPFASRSMH